MVAPPHGRLEHLKFYSQYPIGPYIAAFYLASRKLIIELDGSGHLLLQDYDQDRTHWLNEQAYTVIRFTNDQVRYQLKEVLAVILHSVQSIPGE